MQKIKKSLMLLLTALIWGTAFVAQSKGMDYVEPFTYCGIRMLIGGLVLLPVIKIMDKRKTIEEKNRDKANKKTLILGGLCCGVIIFVAGSFQQIGLQYTTVGKASFITALYIVIVPTLGIFLKKKVPINVTISVIIAVFGFYLLCINGKTRIETSDLLMLFCAFVFSLHILAIDYFSPKVDCVKLSCFQFFTCGIISIIVMFIFEHPDLSGIWAAKGTILYTGILSCGVAYTLQIVAQKDLNPAIASLIMSLESVFGAIAGYIILGDSFTHKELIGCIVVFLAVILAQIPNASNLRISSNNLKIEEKTTETP